MVRDWAMNDVFRAIRPYTVEEFKKAILPLQDDLIAVGLTNIYEPILRDEETARWRSRSSTSSISSSSR